MTTAGLSNVSPLLSRTTYSTHLLLGSAPIPILSSTSICRDRFVLGHLGAPLLNCPKPAGAEGLPGSKRLVGRTGPIGQEPPLGGTSEARKAAARGQSRVAGASALYLEASAASA